MPELTDTKPVNGFQVAGVHCGLKKNENLDFALFVSDHPCTAGAVFTTNQVKAAPVLLDMARINSHGSSIRAVAINSGCANACTGQQGIDNALKTARYIADKIGCDENEVLVMSTGVIGEQLKMDKLLHGVDLAMDALGDDWGAAARAIMTTDTRPKSASITIKQADGTSYTITGIVKGAGMIAPNMATMLSLIVTDAKLSQQQAQTILHRVADKSYNRIVIDGDTSTNDTVCLLANGRVEVLDMTQFEQALEAVSVQLAQAVVRDGEGVTKFITIEVNGAPDDKAAHQIANTLAISPLVKTAFFGQDANWGRFVMAAGRAGVPFNPDDLRVYISDTQQRIPLMINGVPVPNEEKASAIMRQPEITVSLEVGTGSGRSTVWTCDLSHDYVSINADYRT